MAQGIFGMRNPSVMGHQFAKVPSAEIQRSSFKRSHGYKTTFNSGYLIPIYCDEVLPGDTFKLNLSSVARMNTPLFPIIDNLYMDFFFFAVPIRLIWSDFQHFMGEKDNPDDNTEYSVPQIEMGANPVVAGTLGDYFGLPVGVNNLVFNSLHFRAYNLIWNEWFRDQNLQDSVQVDKDSGPDDIADYVLLKRGKRHDYFTSCLPWPQKGEAVSLPLGATAPVQGDGKVLGLAGAENGGLVTWEAANTVRAYTGVYGGTSGEASSGVQMTTNKALGVTTDPDYSGLIADLSTATAAKINDLREAFQLQKLMERDARGGTRYTEIIRSHFLVQSPDARLQRPEYLGGGSVRINIDPVSTTAQGNPTNPLGKLGGIAYCQQSGVGFSKSFVEHCVLLGMMSVRADLTYQTGMDRMWSRQSKYDFYWPALAHLGEQPVLNKEIYAQGTGHLNPVTGVEYDEEVFGYQERWAEYRYKQSLITGVLRSNHASSLDAWHLSQDFASLPLLNGSFIEESPPVSRVIAISGQPEFIFDGYFDITATRPMPIYSVPGLIDHF